MYQLMKPKMGGVWQGNAIILCTRQCTYVNQITFKMENKKKFCLVMYALYSTKHLINILVRKQKGSRVSQVNSRKFPEFQVYDFVCLRARDLSSLNVKKYGLSWSQSIEWFLEDEAFLLSYDLDPPYIPYPSPVSKSLFLSFPVCRRSSLLSEEGRRGEGMEPNYDGEKAWSSINPSILSGLDV